MAGRYERRLVSRDLGIALAVAGILALLPPPAAAQFFGFGYRYEYYGRPMRPPPPRGFFPFPFFSPGPSPYRPPAPTESFKAPPPRKYETQPPRTVVVVGDTMADWLGYGLEETLAADAPDLGIERKIRPASGLIRYDAHNEQLDWAAAIKDALENEKPAAIIVMLGLNDRIAIRDRAPPRPAAARGSEKSGQTAAGANAATAAPQVGEKVPASSETAAKNGEPQAATASEAPRPGGLYEFHTDQWAALYSKRIDEMIAALKSKGVPVLWVGLPAIWGARGITDMSYLDELYRERAERAGIVYVDIWDGFVDENGRFTTQGPDFEGQIRRLRTTDGVHFTKSGAVKLAHYVEQELRRVLLNRLMPVALPAPEENAPKPGAGPRPTVGPVLPLTASSEAKESGDLIGAVPRPEPTSSDPLAMRVLNEGDAIPAPPGRADNFTWPRPGAGGAADTEPAAPSTSPPGPPAPATGKSKSSGPGLKSDAKKTDDAKAKSSPASP